MSVTMTREEREQFLAGVHVGVLSVASAEGGGPLAVPVWYSYQRGGTLDVITGDTTRKAAAIRAASAGVGSCIELSSQSAAFFE